MLQDDINKTVSDAMRGNLPTIMAGSSFVKSMTNSTQFPQLQQYASKLAPFHQRMMESIRVPMLETLKTHQRMMESIRVPMLETLKTHQRMMESIRVPMFETLKTHQRMMESIRVPMLETLKTHQRMMESIRVPMSEILGAQLRMPDIFRIQQRMLNGPMQNILRDTQRMVCKYRTHYSDILNRLTYVQETQSNVSDLMLKTVSSIFDINKNSDFQKLVSAQFKMLRDIEPFSAYYPEINACDDSVCIDNKEINQENCASIFIALKDFYRDCEQKWNNLPKPLRWLSNFFLMIALTPYANDILHNPTTPQFDRQQMSDTFREVLRSTPIDKNPSIILEVHPTIIFIGEPIDNTNIAASLEKNEECEGEDITESKPTIIMECFTTTD